MPSKHAAPARAKAEARSVNESDKAAGNADAHETERLAARRRFLVGGAAALPMVVTLGQKEAWAASGAVCRSQGVYNYGANFTNADNQAGFRASMFCRFRL